MAWAETRTVIRDIVLLVVGTVGALHELLARGGLGERPLIIGLVAGCLGVPVLLGRSEGAK